MVSSPTVATVIFSVLMLTSEQPASAAAASATASSLMNFFIFSLSSFLAKTLLLLMHPSIIQDNGTGCKYYSVTFL